MVSKALDRSRKMLNGTSFLSMWVMILSTSSNSAYYVECFGLKPYGWSKTSLFSLKYVDNFGEREGDMDRERGICRKREREREREGERYI